MSWETIADALYERLAPEGGAWLRQSMAVVSGNAQELRGRWSAAARKLGKAPLALGAADRAQLAQGKAPFVPEGWGADELGRALLLLAALEQMPPGEHPGLVEGLFRTGEMREQQALLKVLAHLPEPDRYVPLALEAVRTNVLPVIEAIACDNPFPERHFPEEAFNQMVLKCLFNGIGLGRIVGLGQRRTPELVRMVAGYASERRAAGRPVPADTALILDGGPHAPV